MIKARIVNYEKGMWDKGKHLCAFELESVGTPEQLIMEAAAIVSHLMEQLEPDSKKNQTLLLMAIIDQVNINLTSAERVATVDALPLKKELDKLKEARGDDLGIN
jgi:hypothetical protein